MARRGAIDPLRVTCPLCGRLIARRGGRLVTHYAKPLTTTDLVEITFGRMKRPEPCAGSRTKAATRKKDA